MYVERIGFQYLSIWFSWKYHQHHVAVMDMKNAFGILNSQKITATLSWIFSHGFKITGTNFGLSSVITDNAYPN